MKKRFNLLIAILGVLLMASVLGLVLSSASRPPVVQEKPLDYWLSGYDGPANRALDPSKPSREAADAAVRQLGTNAIPHLIALLHLSDSAPWKRKLLDVAYKQKFVKFHHIMAWGQNYRAANALGALGADAAGAVPDLIELYERPVSSPSQRYTAMALGRIGPTARPAIPALLRAVNAPTDEEVKTSAIYALGGIHSDATLVVPALTKCLSNSSVEVHKAAIYALAEFGSEARSAIPELVESAQNPDPQIANHAKVALLHIDPEAFGKTGRNNR